MLGRRLKPAPMAPGQTMPMIAVMGAAMAQLRRWVFLPAGPPGRRAAGPPGWRGMSRQPEDPTVGLPVEDAAQWADPRPGSGAG